MFKFEPKPQITLEQVVGYLKSIRDFDKPAVVPEKHGTWDLFKTASWMRGYVAGFGVLPPGGSKEERTQWAYVGIWHVYSVFSEHMPFLRWYYDNYRGEVTEIPIQVIAKAFENFANAMLEDLDRIDDVKYLQQHTALIDMLDKGVKPLRHLNSTLSSL